MTAAVDVGVGLRGVVEVTSAFEAIEFLDVEFGCALVLGFVVGVEKREVGLGGSLEPVLAGVLDAGLLACEHVFCARVRVEGLFQAGLVGGEALAGIAKTEHSNY